MIDYHFVEPPGLHFVKGREPFRLNALLEIGTSILGRPGPEGELSRPLLWDMREVDLLKVETGELKAMIRKREEFGAAHANGLMAIVVGDLGSFGMMRMYIALAEIGRLRNEDRFHLGYDMGEALRWLDRMMGLDAADAEYLFSKVTGLSTG